MASEAVFNLLFQRIDNNNVSLFRYDYKYLEKYFSNFIKTINFIDLNSFYKLLCNIIKLVKINERNLLFECLNNITIKFEKNNDGRKYFPILKSFLTGVNKIKPEDKEEIKKFDRILKPIINIKPNIGKYDLNYELIEVFECYIKCFNGINNITVIILKAIEDLLAGEHYLNISYINFVSTFLSKVKKNIYDDEEIDKKEIYNIIVKIIHKHLNLK